jgi:L-lysine exporter family protein LysE/ArgO
MNAATAAVSGLLFGLSLIVAIGAQNAFVLRQGSLGTHIVTVIVICAASDAALIAAGVGGMGAVVSADHGLLIAVRCAGAALLFAYALLAGRRAFTAQANRITATGPPRSRSGVVAATLAFTWLNPAVYLDTVVLLGSVAGSHPHSRWWFGLGAATASVCWFTVLGIMARLLAPVLRRPSSARGLEAFVSVVMTITALRMLPI